MSMLFTEQERESDETDSITMLSQYFVVFHGNSDDILGPYTQAF